MGNEYHEDLLDLIRKSVDVLNESLKNLNEANISLAKSANLLKVVEILDRYCDKATDCSQIRSYCYFLAEKAGFKNSDDKNCIVENTGAFKHAEYGEHFVPTLNGAIEAKDLEIAKGQLRKALALMALGAI